MYLNVGDNQSHDKEKLYISIQTGISSPFIFNNYLFIQIKGVDGETPPLALLGPSGNVSVFKKYLSMGYLIQRNNNEKTEIQNNNNNNNNNNACNQDLISTPKVLHISL